jgi:hypothetical protein
LLDYIGAMLVVPGHQPEAKAAIEGLCAIVAAVGERYRQQKDLLSLVLLYESTQAGGWLAVTVQCLRVWTVLGLCFVFRAVILVLLLILLLVCLTRDTVVLQSWMCQRWLGVSVWR